MESGVKCQMFCITLFAVLLNKGFEKSMDVRAVFCIEVINEKFIGSVTNVLKNRKWQNLK